MSKEQKQTQVSNQGTKSQAINRLMDALPPHAVEAEESLLGSILIDPTVLNDVQLIIKSGDDFFKKANGSIYEIMTELNNGSLNTVDFVHLSQLLEDRNLLKAIGGG